MVLLPVSVVYLFIGRWVQQPFPLFLDAWGTQNVISFSITLILLWREMRRLGRSGDEAAPPPAGVR